MMSSQKFGPLVGAIDAQSDVVRFMIFAAETAEMLTYHEANLKSIKPKTGWNEQDPYEVLTTIEDCVARTISNMRQLEICPWGLVTIGITTQRETTVVWNYKTGRVLYNAILWDDERNIGIVESFIKDTKSSKLEHLKTLSGLHIDTFFSALKLRWLIENVTEVNHCIKIGECYFGNMDSWIIWNLTGGKHGGIHMTDVTNASRTMLMNIHTLKWDSFLLKYFDIPIAILPQIHSCSEIYGYIVNGMLSGLPISGCLGDQNAAMLGQMCCSRHQIKCSYGMGCFLQYNTGQAVINSEHGLLSTIAYKLGPSNPVVYALEGFVPDIGTVFRCINENLKNLNDFKDTYNPKHQIYFVPAYRGIYSRYRIKNARSIICSFKEDMKENDLLKATLNAMCFQIRDIIMAAQQDMNRLEVDSMSADGWLANNDNMMQLQADIMGIPVVRPVMIQTMALGAAIAAGYADGINVWDLNNVQPAPTDTFYPKTPKEEREYEYRVWKNVVALSIGLTKDTPWERGLDAEETDESNSGIIPAAIFLVSVFSLLIISERLH